MDIETIAGHVRQRIVDRGFDRSIKIDLGSTGILLIDGSDVSVGDGDAECTITMAPEDLEALVAGELDPTSAYMSGKMKILGDMSAAMALGQAL